MAFQTERKSRGPSTRGAAQPSQARHGRRRQTGWAVSPDPPGGAGGTRSPLRRETAAPWALVAVFGDYQATPNTMFASQSPPVGKTRRRPSAAAERPGQKGAAWRPGDPRRRGSGRAPRVRGAGPVRGRCGPSSSGPDPARGARLSASAGFALAAARAPRRPNQTTGSLLRGRRELMPEPGAVAGTRGTRPTRSRERPSGHGHRTPHCRAGVSWKVGAGREGP